MNEPEDFDTLERWMDRRLHNLPPPTSPLGLTERIMDRVHHVERSPQSVVSAAPRVMRFQWAFGLLGLGLLGLLLSPVADHISAFWWTSDLGRFCDAFARLYAVMERHVSLWIGSIPPMVWGFMSLSIGMAYVLTFVLGSALYRLAHINAPPTSGTPSRL